MRFLIVIVFSILLVVEIKKVISDDVIMQKDIFEKGFEPLPEPRRKKPFCNAFTGCGRKRIDYSMPILEEFNIEPPVDEFTRQLASKSRLLEALQEAHQNALYKKQKEWAELRQLQNPFFSSKWRRCVNSADGIC